MRKEEHTAIWKNIIKNSVNQLEFLHKEFNFEKPKISRIKDETHILCTNNRLDIYTTIFDGQLIAPVFKIKNKETNEFIELDSLDKTSSLNNSQKKGIKETKFYLERVEVLIRKFLNKENNY